MTQVQQLSPQLQEEFRRRRRRRLVLAVLGVLLIPLLFGSRWLYQQGKGWRARQLARQAEVLIEKEQWQEASDKAHVAYQLKFDEPASLRVVAHLYRAMGRSAEALPFWKQLDEYHALTLDDRRRRAEDFFRAGNVEEATTENNRLLAQDPHGGENLRLAARLALAQGKKEVATEYARRAAEVEPDQLEGRFLLALLELDSADPSVKEAGIKALFALGRTPDKPGLSALLALASRKDLPPGDIEALIPLLQQHPLAAEPQKLITLDLEIARQPEQREAILDRAMAEYAKADPARKRNLGIWLNAHQEWKRTLTLLPLAEALQRKDVLLARLDAQASLRQWVEIQKTLEGEEVPLDPMYRELFLARSAMEQGQTIAAAAHWTRAHTAAGPVPEQMWFVARYAETVGQLDRARQAYESLTANSNTARPAYEALLRLAGRQNQYAAQRDLLRDMHQRWPADQPVANDYAYYSLLVGQDVAEHLRTARALVAQNPSSLPHRTTLALALLRQNNPKAASEVYNGLNIPWATVPSSARVVHAAVLGQNGAEEEARAEVSRLRSGDLRAEERELIRRWLPEESATPLPATTPAPPEEKTAAGPEGGRLP